MLGKIASAFVGKKIADRYGEGGKGALIGWMAPAIARRAIGPLGVALAGGYVAKKVYDRRRGRRAGRS